MKKNGDANNNPTLIIVLAVIFILGGLGSCVAVIGNFQAFLLVLGLILLAVGILFMVYGIKRKKTLKAYSELLNDPNAFMTTATFVKAKFASYSSTSVGVGGISLPTSVNVYKKIVYTYVDETGTTQNATSSLSYTPNQVDYLKEKGTFKIKCKGKVSVIIEEIPTQNKNFNL